MGVSVNAHHALKREEEKWNPVFLYIHATTENLDQDDVSIKHHPELDGGTHRPAPGADSARFSQSFAPTGQGLR